MNPNQKCSNCKHSEGWSLTPGGKIRAHTQAKCTYKIETLPPLPSCVRMYESRITVRPHDGTACPVWEAKP